MVTFADTVKEKGKVAVKDDSWRDGSVEERTLGATFPDEDASGDLPDGEECRLLEGDAVGDMRRPLRRDVAHLPVLSHLDWLESESVHILREVAGQCANPALLFSGGKDSIVLLHLATKAFRPARFPFPLMHIDTGHNFREVIEFRDARAAELGERLLVRSVEGCAYQIRYLLTHPELAAQLGKNGHEHVKENFLMTTNVRRWLLLFRILLGNRGSLA